MLLKMGNFARVVGSLTASVLLAYSASASNIKKQSKPLFAQSVKPCDASAFHLSVQVEPAQDANAQNKLGLEIDGNSQNPKLNRARRTHVGQDSDFSASECKLWQSRSMQWLLQAGLENSAPERKGVSCINIASVDLVIDGKSKKYKFCLADSKTDAVSFAFQKFYTGTDALVKR